MQDTRKFTNKSRRAFFIISYCLMFCAISMLPNSIRDIYIPNNDLSFTIADIVHGTTEMTGKRLIPISDTNVPINFALKVSMENKAHWGLNPVSKKVDNVTWFIMASVWMAGGDSRFYAA